MARKNQAKPALSGSTNRERLLSPAEKSKQLGVSTDTLRRWENDGRIESVRTAGGQRRYRENDVPGAVCEDDDDADSGELEVEDIPQAASRETRESPPASTPPWQERIEERRADLEVAKLDREHRAILRAEAQEREERRRRREEDERRAADEREHQAAALRERQRMESIVQQGMMHTLTAPTEYQAMVRGELLKFVTPERFAAGLSPMEAGALIAARVEHVLKPWRDKQRVDELFREARSRVALRTLGSDWEYEAAQEARREVEDRLSREIEPTWTKGQVHARVDEILDEWE